MDFIFFCEYMDWSKVQTWNPAWWPFIDLYLKKSEAQNYYKIYIYVAQRGKNEIESFINLVLLDEKQ